MEIKFRTNSPEETEAFGRRLASFLSPGDIVAFRGELGAGKTCMIRGIAAGLGVKTKVTSSSFVLMRALEGRCMVYHFDLYRLCDREELIDVGYDEFMFSDGISLVEWPEKMGDWIGDRYLSVEIEYDEDSEDLCGRTIRIVPQGSGFERLTGELK